MIEDLKDKGIDLNYIPFDKNNLTWLFVEETVSKFVLYDFE